MMTMVKFPALPVRSLEGRNLELPGDFASHLAIALVAFQRWHQGMVNSWTPWLETLTAKYPDVQAYEIPVLSNIYTFMRWMIDGSMIAATPSQQARAHTLTAYTDVGRVVRSLGLTDTSTITIVLVDRTGQIYWQGYGEYSAQQAGALEQALIENQ